MATSGCAGLTHPGDGVTKEEGAIISPTVHIPNHYVPNILNSCLDSAGPIPYNQMHRNSTITIFWKFYIPDIIRTRTSAVSLIV